MSLRTRLLLTFTVLAAALAGAAYATARSVQAQLIRQADRELDGADVLGRFGTDDRGHGRDSEGGERQRGGFNAFYVAELIDGAIVRYAQPEVSDKVYPDPQLDAADVAEKAGGRGMSSHFTAPSVGDTSLSYRVEVRPDARSDRVVILGLPLDSVDDSISAIQRMAWWLGVITVGLVGLAAWWLTRLGLRPIRRMTAAASGIAEGSLSQRVPVESTATEAGQLGAALNGMLDRLETSFDERTRTEDRLRQFAADASHELRTPVQTIRGYGELYRMGALHDEARLSDAMRRTEQEASRMGRIIEDLLLLARLDQQRPLDRRPVDVVGLVRDAAADARAVQPDRIVTTAAPDEVTIVGDEMKLRQVLGNLVGNALAHTPIDSPVTLAVAVDSTSAIITVADAGPGMDDESAAHAFERFFRSDRSRSRAHGGSGLGLSIVQGFIEEHGGTVTLHSDLTVGTRVTIILPLLASAM